MLSRKNNTRKAPFNLLMSIREEELPGDWRRELNRMRRLRSDTSDGLLSLFDRTPPAAKTIEDISYTLRAFGRVCRDNELPIDLNRRTIELWVKARHDAKNKNISIAKGLAALKSFSTWCEINLEVIEIISNLQKRYRKAARKDPKRKDVWFLKNKLNLADVWERALELQRQARAAAPGSAVQRKLTLEAACLALSIACPLRIGDLYRFRIGEHLLRHATYWSLSIKTSKTGLQYDRPKLWQELTPFLDDVLFLGMPDSDIWRAVDRKMKTPLFTRDGFNAVSNRWPSYCWRRHFGVGAHIVRSLWHSMMFESEDDDQWIALALCGQGNGKTAQAYILEGCKRRASRRARSKLFAARKAALTA